MRLFSSKPKTSSETERKIKANDPVYNAQFKYADNFIKTSKYTVLTFLPVNLLEQFRRLANFYFLCLLILQVIPIISSLTFVTTLVPMVGVLSVTAIKDAYDDYQRHRSDSQVNNRLSQVVRNGQLVQEKWFKIRVGDIIKLNSDDFIAADLLLLSTSEPNGLCYIETAELDGETNLKCRQTLPETQELDQNLGNFDAEIICEPPNNHLSKFEGTLFWNGQKYPLDNDKIILRGCIMRNTNWCYGVVIFAGRDTKLMMNSGKTSFKRTSIDRMLNQFIVGIVIVLLVICLFCTIGCGIWETVTGQFFRVYLPWDVIIPKDKTTGATLIAFLIFFSYIIVLNTLMPISLYVSVEIIRLIQSFFINWDENMCYHQNNEKFYAKARTTTLNEELGQIEYIFSDKTGTLTQNIMTFNKCSIRGRSYGDKIDEVTGEPMVITEDTPSVKFIGNPFTESTFKWYDQATVDSINAGDAASHEFFRLLALCHTVMAEEKNGKLEYQAQSPDEGALVTAARNFGFVFKERTPNTITVIEVGKVEVYELLCILDFNNVRKRMSVVVKKDNKIKLYCKGADNIVFERLKAGDNKTKSDTQEHLDRFAGDGLRTLVIASKDLDEEYFEQWKERHHEAATALDNRDDKLDEIYEEIERDLQLVGVTAIEDKLQDGVPQTIANLMLGNIKIWVLTGDKQETAINIGYSCELLQDDMAEVFVIDGTNLIDVQQQLRKHLQTVRNIQSQQKGGKGSLSVVTFSDSVEFSRETTGEQDSISASCALVINGHSLVHALHTQLEELFLELSCLCRSVICCRVTPLQKAMVVELVKRHKKAVTLSIGDGANDVSMIKTAHIGVGISGQEGLQAVLSSDYSIAQFRYLERLLIVHGRWSYLRMCKFLRYFFYKNFAFTLCNFMYAFFCGFSAQTMYDPFFISCYNLFYTSLPVLALGALEKDVSDTSSIAYPKLYAPGHDNSLFNKVEFGKSAIHGLYTALILFFVPYAVYRDAVGREGVMLSDLMVFGSVVAAFLILAVTIQMALDTTYWTWIHLMFVLLSVLSYFILTFFTYQVIQGPYMGSLGNPISEANFWFTLFLTQILLSLPIVSKRFYYASAKPTLTDRVRLLERQQKVLRRRPPPSRVPSSMRRSRRSLRSGYAFSHDHGYGRLITSGTIMRKGGRYDKRHDMRPPTTEVPRTITLVTPPSPNVQVQV